MKKLDIQLFDNLKLGDRIKIINVKKPKFYRTYNIIDLKPQYLKGEPLESDDPSKKSIIGVQVVWVKDELLELDTHVLDD